MPVRVIDDPFNECSFGFRSFDTMDIAGYFSRSSVENIQGVRFTDHEI